MIFLSCLRLTEVRHTYYLLTGGGVNFCVKFLYLALCQCVDEEDTTFCGILVFISICIFIEQTLLILSYCVVYLKRAV